MLNRLYIVIGVLAILILGGGFVIPGFIDWSGYRDRLEALAEAGLGTDVIIAGEIDFTLLPQPRLRFGKTIVGPADAPLLEIRNIVAEFSLMDFLRDRFKITSLVLQSPVINLAVSKNGGFEMPITLAQQFEASNISVASALIKDGTLRFADQRSGENWQARNFDGELKVTDVRGSFALQGIGEFAAKPYALRINTSAINDNGEIQASVFIRPEDGTFSLAANGLLTLGERPSFEGQTTFRGTPPGEIVADRVQGDFILASEIKLNPEKLLLSAFVIQPDENRAGTRLTGAAEVQLGENRSFNAVISGGVVALPPRDLRESAENEPLALVHLLDELPALFVPPLKGRVGVDIAELNLRAFSLREVRIDATTDGESWELGDFTGRLPGDTELTLTGTLFDDGGRMGYDGTISLSTARPDTLALLWRRAGESNPLFNIEVGLDADLSLSGGEFNVSNGKLDVDGASHDFAGLFTLRETRNALVSARLSAMDRGQSEALLALLPDFLGNSAFGATFTTGSLDVGAQAATVLGLPGEKFALQMDWDGSGLNISRLSVQDFGGARLAVSGTVSGTISEPVLAGGGRISLSQPAADGFLPLVMARFGGDATLEAWIARTLPIDANINLAPPDQAGGQDFTALGRAGEVDFNAEVLTAGNIAALASAPIVVEGQLRSDNGTALSAQFGLGEVALLSPETPMVVDFRANGTISNSVQATISAQGGGERLAYTGNLILSDPAELRGRGIVDFAIVDFAPLLDLVGANGLHLPGLEGTLDVSFSGTSVVTLDNLLASGLNATGARVGGQISIIEAGDKRLLSGQLDMGAMDVQDILAFLGGGASLIKGDGVWPEGPVDLGSFSHNSGGRIAVSTPKVSAGGLGIAQQVSFDVVWDADSIALENISGSNGNDTILGTVSGRLELCCATLAAQKQLSGRLSLSGVPVKNILPLSIAQNLDGVLEGGVIVDATGASIGEMVASLSGEGSFSVTDLEVAKLDPAAFSALTQIEDITGLGSDALTIIVALALEKGNFSAGVLGGAFQIAGGVVRADNLATEGAGANLIGDISVNLYDLGLGGSWTLTPTELDDADGLIDQNTARITALAGGSLMAPERELDLSLMVDAIQVRALEIELAKLEQLRLEQETRSKAAAERRAMLMELEAQRLKGEGDRLAAEAERRAAEDEAARLAEEALHPADETTDLTGSTDPTDPVDPTAGDPLVIDLISQDPLVFNPAIDPPATDLLSGQ